MGSSSGGDPAAVRLELYVAGRSVRSSRAIENLRHLLEGDLSERFEVDLKVVDIREEPARAESARILTTPTVIKTSPAPQRRVTGDLSDAEALLAALALEEHQHDAPPPRRTGE